MEIDPALFQENERLAPKDEVRQFRSVGPIDLVPGGHLEDVTVAYETWGRLNERRNNAILICHALSGDSHAIGWWGRIVGPGKAIDTEKFFVIGTNALGGCQGTTGPASLSPRGTRYGSSFPAVTVQDMVQVQHRLMGALGIDVLHGIAGGSMGGMQALEYSRSFPGEVRNVWMTASCAGHSAMQIAFNEAGRQAIMRDPKWLGGDYDPADPPANGISVARMIGHLSYLSEASFESKFGRNLQDKDALAFDGGTEFQVESYLNYQGDKFVSRFDANSYLTLTRAIDYYHADSLVGAKSRYLLTSFTSDWLYPSHQSEAVENPAKLGDCDAYRYDISLPFGHDSFLLDGEQQSRYVHEFLAM